MWARKLVLSDCYFIRLLWKGGTNMKEPNERYKDTVFRLLYSNPTRALSLYNSINNTDYDDPSMLEFNTIENAIFMKYIPVSLNTIFNAKVLSGFIVSQIMILFVYIGCLFIYKRCFKFFKNSNL